MPAAYLTGEAWFAGLSFKTDRARAGAAFADRRTDRARLPALARRPRSAARARPVHRFGLHRHRDGALQPGLARRRRRPQRRRAGAGAARTRRACTRTTCACCKSDLFSSLQGEHYDLIVTNPPYVTNAETDALPKEYAYEPDLGLRAGDDGLDLALKILRDAPLHLTDDGLLICEVGEAEQALVEAAAGTAAGLGRVQGRADGHLRRRARATWSRTTRASANSPTRAARALTHREHLRQAVPRHHLRRIARAGDRLRDRRLPAGHRARAGGLPRRPRAPRHRHARRHTSQRHEADEVEILSRRVRRPHHRHADRAADPQHRRAQQGLRRRSPSSSAPATPTTPTGRSTASAIRAAAGARRRARPRCASPRR